MTSVERNPSRGAIAVKHAARWPAAREDPSYIYVALAALVAVPKCTEDLRLDVLGDGLDASSENDRAGPDTGS